MRSSSALLALPLVSALLTCAETSRAQSPQGFAVERFHSSAPGAGWLVMDDLSMHGSWGGALALSGGYASRPMRVSDGTTHLAVVSDQAFADVGASVSHDRYRLYLNLTSPLLITGDSGSLGSYTWSAPNVDAGKAPDLIGDVRVGFDARIVGDHASPFRLGAGAQLYVPNGNRADYDTDGTLRAMLRVLFAGDLGALTYAGQLGVHVRPVDDSPAPVNPRGSELLFGVAAGARAAITKDARVVVGPEVFGATALRSAFATEATALEGMLSARFETGKPRGVWFRCKLGIGAGLDASFGAPAWRGVLSVEMLGANDAGN